MKEEQTIMGWLRKRENLKEVNPLHYSFIYGGVQCSGIITILPETDRLDIFPVNDAVMNTDVGQIACEVRQFCRNEQWTPCEGWKKKQP